jgi:hypothetical protein
MFQKIFTAISFGDRYWVASVVYLGLTLVFWGTSPNWSAIADVPPAEGVCYHEYTYTDESGTHTEIREGCQEGYMCCTESQVCVEIED